MNLELKDITAKLGPSLQGMKRYITFGFVLIVLIIYGYLVFHINTLAAKEPDEDAVTERLKTVQRPRIDDESLQKILQLEGQNIQVQTLFNEARENPFTE